MQHLNLFFYSDCIGTNTRLQNKQDENGSTNFVYENTCDLTTYYIIMYVCSCTKSILLWRIVVMQHFYENVVMFTVR